jgi:adenylate cyclase class IV
MPKEYEYSFQDFDKLKIVSKLKDLKAVYKGNFLFRVQQFKLPNQPDIKKYRARVRDEGHRITMTIKTTTADFDEEKEIIIDNFENGVMLLLQLGCTKHVYYEKIREIYYVKGSNVRSLWNGSNVRSLWNEYSEIVFYTEEGFPEIMEIESPTFEELEKMVKIFKLQKNINNISDIHLLNIYSSSSLATIVLAVLSISL